MVTKLRKLASREGSEIDIKYDDELGITCVLPMSLVTIRSKRRVSTMSDEQKLENAERLRKWRAEQNEDS